MGSLRELLEAAWMSAMICWYSTMGGRLKHTVMRHAALAAHFESPWIAPLRPLDRVGGCDTTNTVYLYPTTSQDKTATHPFRNSAVSLDVPSLVATGDNNNTRVRRVASWRQSLTSVKLGQLGCELLDLRRQRSVISHSSTAT
jgi:hypothetical protein